MLTAIIICSDARSVTLADVLRADFEVYIAQRDTAVGKRYGNAVPPVRWVFTRSLESNSRRLSSRPSHVDIAFVHSGNTDPEGLIAITPPRAVFVFSANGVQEARSPWIAIQRPFPEAGDSPISQAEARNLAVLVASGADLNEPSVRNQIPFCSPTVSASADPPSDPAAELLALERLLAIGGLDEASMTSEATAFAQANPSHRGIYTQEECRPKVWHLTKNVLLRHAHNSVGSPVVTFVLDRMRRWEIQAWGATSMDLNRIAELLAFGNRTAAADLAAACYRRYAHGDLTASQDGRAASPKTSPLAERGKYIAVLMVDDDREFADQAVMQLEELAESQSSYAVEIVSASGASAFSDALALAKQHGGIAGLIVDWDLSSGGARAGTGVDLIRKIWETLPRAHACLLTGRGPLTLTDEIGVARIRPFSKTEADCLKHAFAFIMSSIRDREATPFFTALAGYSGRQISTFHALAISGGSAVRKSPWLDGFFNFYGDRVFLAETSSTQPPLDSLLAPTGTIRDAEARAAVVFGAERVRFVTNGTSTANKIVHQALLRPGDVVLVDRTCHKSHHYGFVLVGARPVYIGAEPVTLEGEFLGFCKGVKTNAIVSALRANPTARMLCLTNCTFDGYTHHVAEIIDCVLSTLREMGRAGTPATKPEDFVFLVDEAWFGAARFTSALRPFTAMEACHVAPEARVYATQSTHKTLVAFRQGSMILVRDPQFASIEPAFSEALFTHTTTSPNYSIIASLDAGRMWADLDGDRICNGAWRISEELRRQLAQDQLVASKFTVLSAESLLQGVEDSEMMLDATKITLYIKDRRVSGRQVNAALLAEEDIQFNKFTNNTVLLMVTPGATESAAAHLVVAVRRLAARLSKGADHGLERSEMLSEVFEAQCAFREDFDLRSAYFGQAPDWLALWDASLAELSTFLEHCENATDCVSAGFVIPYPPGFPILVPGQTVTVGAIRYLKGLDSREVHGMPNRDRLRVWIRSELRS